MSGMPALQQSLYPASVKSKGNAWHAPVRNHPHGRDAQHVQPSVLLPLRPEIQIRARSHLNNIVSFRFVQRNNLIMLDERQDYADFCRAIDRDKLVFFE